MKEVLTNIWEAPSSDFEGVIIYFFAVIVIFSVLKIVIFVYHWKSFGKKSSEFRKDFDRWKPPHL